MAEGVAVGRGVGVFVGDGVTVGASVYVAVMARVGIPSGASTRAASSEDVAVVHAVAHALNSNAISAQTRIAKPSRRTIIRSVWGSAWA